MSRALKIGDEGPDVAALQNQLDIAADGKFGPTTQAAVIAYQAAFGLVADGVVGPATLAALANAEARQALTPASDGINDAGWYRPARCVPAHPGRVGAEIVPCAVVVHTTDCMPGSMPGIVQRWSETAGEGAGAHFVIGRSAVDGVVQMVPINHNGNHAGGSKKVGADWVPWHGNYRTTSGKVIHPNTVAIGIELDNGGYLGKPRADGRFVHRDSGGVVSIEDVQIDATGHGWCRVTDYQYMQLDLLLKAIAPRLVLQTTLKRTNGLTVAPNGTYKDNGVPWAEMPDALVVGHVTLDPNNKTDPGPFVLDWLRARA